MSAPPPVEPLSMNVASRSVRIQITNQTNIYTLMNPQVAMMSGVVYARPASTVKPMESEVSSFIKKSIWPTGSVGVMTYELQSDNSSKDEILAIMFSVPFDYMVYSNWFGVEFYDHGRACDEKLFDEMEDERRRMCGSEIYSEGKFLKVKAKMLDQANSVLTVELSTRK
ncbi:DELTA-thalatoxin-Avl1a-like [Osmerus eperlanus]|uniref:DELTA-thalatoxin-Avl1a-like n=1 Tax=Osmerus eperlanus TaxID=29151 RepID=UPI002E0EF465